MDARLTHSARLLSNPLEPGEAGYDKISILGKVEAADTTWTINIAEDTPTAVLLPTVRDKLELRSPLVAEMKVGKRWGLSLISGGTFLWIGDRLAVLKRRPAPPVGALTSPAGRCGEYPSLTNMMELNQELLIIINDGGHTGLLAFGSTPSGETFDRLTRSKLEQVEYMRAKYLGDENKKAADLLSKIITPGDIICINPNDFPGGGTIRVITRVDGRVEDVVEGTATAFHEKSNTLEIRATVKLPELEVLGIFDGEPYGQEALLLTPHEIAAYVGGQDPNYEKCVPALRHYIDNL